MGQSYNTLRERLRDTYREADAKAGELRVELNAIECWAPWLAWLLDGWSGQQIAIAIVSGVNYPGRIDDNYPDRF